MAVFDAEIIYKKNIEWRKDHREESTNPTIVDQPPNEEIDLVKRKRQRYEARSFENRTNEVILASEEIQKVSEQEFVLNSPNNASIIPNDSNPFIGQ